MKYFLYGLSLLIMVVALILSVPAIHDVTGDPSSFVPLGIALGLLLLAGVLWILVEISERLEGIARKSETNEVRKNQGVRDSQAAR
jgi:hypothetical protein